MKIEDAIPQWCKELQEYVKEMHGTAEKAGFSQTADLEQVMRALSGFSSRATHIRLMLVNHPNNPKCTRMRIDTVDPFLEEVERQFKFFSRIQTIIQSEMELTR